MKSNETSEPKLLISYRRIDTQHVTERTAEILANEFGRDAVFLDTEDIPIGREFDDHIRNSLTKCRVVLAIIGEFWLEATDDSGKRRLDDEKDTVRRELEWAKAASIDIVPILIDRARMPRKKELPSTLQFLAGINALPVRSGQDFRFCTQRLIVLLQDSYGFPVRQKTETYLSWIYGVGLGCAIFGGITSIMMVIQSALGVIYPLQTSADFIFNCIAMELVGPILLGASLLAIAYSCHRSCMLRALHRRPDYLGIANIRRIKHPDVQYSLAFSLAGFGWNLFAAVPALYYNVRARKQIRASPQRYEGLSCANVAIILIAIGVFVSSFVQLSQFSQYRDLKMLESAATALSKGELTKTIDLTLPVASRRDWPQTEYLLGKAALAQNRLIDAKAHFTKSIQRLRVIYDRDRNALVQPIHFKSVVAMLIDAYTRRAECLATLDEHQASKSDKDRAEAIRVEVTHLMEP